MLDFLYDLILRCIGLHLNLAYGSKDLCFGRSLLAIAVWFLWPWVCEEAEHHGGSTM